MRCSTLFVVTLLSLLHPTLQSLRAADPAVPLPVVVPADDPHISYVGRFSKSDPKAPRCAWSASQVRLRFEGTAINAVLSDGGQDRFQVVVDGKPTSIVRVKGKEQVASLATGLTKGEHTVELWRATEASFGPNTFHGFQLDEGATPLDLAPARHQIEVIGDSISCGYGNEGKNQNEHFSADTENAYLSYGAIAARELGADYACVAWSGKKMAPNNTIPELYDRTLPFEANSKFDPAAAGWKPDVVLVNLATNDFAKENPEEEMWVKAYHAFLEHVRERYPKARLYCALGPMMSDKWSASKSALSTARKYLNRIVDERKAKGDANIAFLEFDMQDGKRGFGADWHPSVKQHQFMAEKFVKAVKEDLKWEEKAAKPQANGELRPPSPVYSWERAGERVFDRASSGSCRRAPLPRPLPGVPGRGRLLLDDSNVTGSSTLLGLAPHVNVVSVADSTLAIDTAFPGGNGTIEKIDGDDITLRPDLRDTAGDWFYWCVRIKGAAGRTLTFHFSHSNPVGVRGPAVSVDGGKSWKWGEKPKDFKTFTYTVPKDAGDDVRFSFGMTYTAAQLDTFLDGLPKDAPVKKGELCKSRKGRAVTMLNVGKLDGEPKFRVFVTARHHCCEMMASYAVEGMIQAVLANDDTGKWLRENVELLVVPMVDWDGVEDGDQGKNRKPRDHNRDYDGQSLYPETAAIRELVPKWSKGKLVATFDMHCPAIRGADNERIYQVGREDPAMQEQQNVFGKLLEAARTGPLPYKLSNDIPYGTAWNTAANYTQGMSSGKWGSIQPGVKLATTFELPYANAQGVEVTAESARAFGQDVGRGLKAYLEQLH